MFVKLAPSPDTYVKTPPAPNTFPPVILPVADTTPVVFKFPESVLPVTATDVKVPVLVMFGCAAVSTVPDVSAYVAFATVPVTFAPATALAVPANAT